MDISNINTIVVRGCFCWGKGHSIEEAFEEWLKASRYEQTPDSVNLFFTNAEPKDVRVTDYGSVTYPQGSETMHREMLLSDKTKRLIKKAFVLRDNLEEVNYKISCELSQ